MFAVLVSGHLVSTDFHMLGEHFMIDIPDPDTVNHIAVFMTGVQAFPDGYSGLVYFNYLQAGRPNENNWKLLGYIGNDKPSTIFRVSGLKTKIEPEVPYGLHEVYGPANAQICIKILETTEAITLMSALVSETELNNLSQVQEFTRKMVESFVNYASSFAVPANTPVPQTSDAFIPISAIYSWYENFKRKLNLNPFFWKA